MRIIDVSEHQGEIDWDAAASTIDGAIARASGYGWDRTDYQFIRNRDELRRIGIARGWYYFAGLGDPVQQANRFADIVGPLQDSETVWLDWEADVMAEGEAWALAFLRHISGRFGVTCGIYMSASPASSGWETVRAEGYPLWVAAYNCSNAFWPDDDADHWPYAIWQYSSAGSVAGINGPVDMNTVIAWPSGTTAPQPQPTSEDEDMEVTMELIRYPYNDGIERWQAFLDSDGYDEWAIFGMAIDDKEPLSGQVIVKHKDGAVVWYQDFTLTHALPYQDIKIPAGHFGRLQVDYAEAGRGDVPTRRSVKR